MARLSAGNESKLYRGWFTFTLSNGEKVTKYLGPYSQAVHAKAAVTRRMGRTSVGGRYGMYSKNITVTDIDRGIEEAEIIWKPVGLTQPWRSARLVHGGVEKEGQASKSLVTLHCDSSDQLESDYQIGGM